MQELKIGINTPYIQIDKLLKLANIVSSGGEAHIMILDGCVSLDGNIVTEKRKKVYPNNTVFINDEYIVTVFEEYEA